MTDAMRAELIEWQSRCGDLQNSVERLREERDSARATVDLMLHENHRLEEALREANATISRLRIHIQQGIEL